MKKKLKKRKGDDLKIQREPSITSSSNGKKKSSPNQNKPAIKEHTSSNNSGKYSTHELAAMNNLSRSYSVTFSSDLLSQLEMARSDIKKAGGAKRKK